MIIMNYADKILINHNHHNNLRSKEIEIQALPTIIPFDSIQIFLFLPDLFFYDA